jgi:hypothetical protein
LDAVADRGIADTDPGAPLASAGTPADPPGVAGGYEEVPAAGSEARRPGLVRGSTAAVTADRPPVGLAWSAAAAAVVRPRGGARSPVPSAATPACRAGGDAEPDCRGNADPADLTDTDRAGSDPDCRGNADPDDDLADTADADRDDADPDTRADADPDDRGNADPDDDLADTAGAD